MIRTRTIISLAALILSASIAMQAQSSVRSIDSYVKRVERAAKSPSKLIIADTADYQADRPNWRKFTSEASLEKFRESADTFTMAFCWKIGGKIAAVKIANFTPSGDWARYTDHYFRTDGSLARVDSEMRTFDGDYIIEQSLYFNAAGRRIRRTVRYYDLRTKKPKKMTDEMKAETKGYLEFDHYKNTRKLPFARIAGIR